MADGITISEGTHEDAAFIETRLPDALRRALPAARRDTSNPAARTLYESLGYEVFGELATGPIKPAA